MTKENFGYDSGEYELLTEAVELSKDIEGVALEIGLRLGFGTATIIEAVAKFCPDKYVASMDPYGSILYEGREGQVCRLDYDETMRNTCLSNMYRFVIQHGVHWKLIELTDTDFFEQCRNGIIFYNLERVVINKYSLIHFDGPHNIEALKSEFSFFYPRMSVGGILCFDDCSPDFFDTDLLEEHMGDKVEVVKKGVKKWLYRKV